MELALDLAQAKCTHPFAHLGPKYNTKKSRLTISAYVVEAIRVEAFDIATGESLGELTRVGSSDLFRTDLDKVKAMVNYELEVENSSHTYRYIDPYQFQEQAYHAVHFVDHAPENLYQQLGAQLTSVTSMDGKEIQGTRFAVFAPNASAASLIGDFNLWNGCCHPMQKTDIGYWVLFVPGVKAGAKYKYQLKDAEGNDLPHKADPVGFYADQYPSHASLVFDHNQYQWRDKAWLDKAAASNPYTMPMSIYEVHLGSWKRPGEADRRYLSYEDLASDLIPYVKEMGYTHIEVLPVSEFPFDGSWGYQPVGMFSPTSRFGDPDQFKHFVDQCHQHDLGVIIDWVPAHFPEDGHGLARFDGSFVYEYEDPRRGWHQDWNSCIYDFGKDTVRQFLVASALFWLDKFHVDGLRVDAVASMLYLDYSRKAGEWLPNIDGGNENYEAISLLKWMNQEVYAKHPHAITIAEESTSFPKVSRPVFDGGLGFGFKWNMGWMHDSLHYISKDPAYRRFHHNEITFSMVYAFDESFILPISHDEVVHGKGSLMRKMPGDEWQQAASLRCYTAFMYAHPGKKLHFMGNEIGQTEEWNHDSSVNWHLLEYDKHQGIQRLYRELNHLYRSQPALYEQDHHYQGFNWLEHESAELSLLAFQRISEQGKQIVSIVSNFTPVPRESFQLGVPQAGEYQVLLNTDDTQFWGSGFATQERFYTASSAWQGQPDSIRITLPPMSTLIIGLVS
jgi:1,4-alpha-glucan branching enzyme